MPNGTTDPNPSNNTATDTIEQPHVRLVKRITALNGQTFTDIIYDPNDPNDDSSLKWTAGYLKGKTGKGITAGDQVTPQPGDIVEYAIYFLSDSAGSKDAAKVGICDLVPANTTFVTNAFKTLTPTDGGLPGTDSGIALTFGSNSPTYLTNVSDADRGQFLSPGNQAPAACNISSPNSPVPGGSNVNGAVFIDVVKDTTTLPKAITSGNPANSYGFIRFKAKVN